jgi:5-methylcytosine-specific restriction endonuclease McrA
MKRTKALEIPKAVKERVAERDSFDGHPCCLLCGSPAPVNNRLAFSCAHYISRAQGGLGVEENVVTLCPDCHINRYDQGSEREQIRAFLRVYLEEKYPNWNEEKLIYKKGQ